MPHRFLQLVDQGHRHDEHYEIGEDVHGGDDGRSEIGVDAVVIDADLPIRIDGQALEDGSEGLHETVADDEDADYLQRQHELAVHVEDAIVQV